MQQFRDLKVWQRSHALVVEVYRLSRAFPDTERYGLTAQLRRAAVSVPTNIAEGAKRATGQDYARFLNVAEASLAETDYLLLLAKDLEYAAETTVSPLQIEIAELERMLYGLRTKVEEGVG